MTHYLITGGTGLIGSALCRYFSKDKHQVTVLSRQASSVAKCCGDNINAVTSLYEIDESIKIDAVINLAGAPIADRPWTQKRKTILEQSRIGLTLDLISWLKQREIKPNCLISGSAVGWYGNGKDKLLTEESGFNDEYTHQLCEAWEQQALQAQELGIRVCILRTGLVLSAKGGFLKKMLPPFKLGFGGRLGDGKQFMPWIHINDIVKLIVFLLEQGDAQGVFNACSPSPVSNTEFSKTLAQQLHRPAILPVPAWVLKTMLGEMSRLLLTGQRVLPKKARALGFQFDYTELNSALADILSSK